MIAALHLVRESEGRDVEAMLYTLDKDERVMGFWKGVVGEQEFAVIREALTMEH